MTTSFQKGVIVPPVCVAPGMRQQNDRGSQYRSAVYTSSPAQHEAALKSKASYQQVGRPGAARCLNEAEAEAAAAAAVQEGLLLFVSLGVALEQLCLIYWSDGRTNARLCDLGRPVSTETVERLHPKVSQGHTYSRSSSFH